MILLIVGLAVFAAIHLMTAVPSLHSAWRARFGKRHRLIFGLLLLVALAIIIIGWRLSPLIPVYDPPASGRYVTFIIVLLAFFCLGIFLFRGTLRQRLRFPLATGIFLLGAGHLFSNGDAAGLILFGGMMIYAVLHIGLGLANGIMPSADVRVGHDGLALLAGAALYGVMTQLHPALIGVPILDLGAAGGPG